MSEALEDEVFARLADILEHERELLQAGRAPEIAELIQEKLDALQAFESLIESGSLAAASGRKRQMVEYILQLAEENSAHMQAVRNGLRHAITRLEGLNTSAHVGSYQKGGGQMSFTNATGIFNRKA